ncbi:MAG: hypothetical protein ACO24T_06845 [Hylemonella sp.]
MAEPSTDCLLLKATGPVADGAESRWAEAVRTLLGSPADLFWAYTAKAENQRPMHHVYLHLPKPMAMERTQLDQAQQRWHDLAGCNGTLSRLHCAMRLPGASAGAQAGVHYVVETDPEAGWHEEIFRWYDQEHMPGLASVSGTVLAQRFVNLDHSPQSFSCYDLLGTDVLGSPPWLAVRGTAWSDVCRPHFTNTLRTMFQTIHQG